MTPEQNSEPLTFTPLAPSAQIVAFTAQNNALKAQVAALEAQLKAHAAPAPIAFGQPFTNSFSDASPSGPHLFFPHLQTSGGDYGKSVNPEPGASGASPSVAQSGLDIAEAASIGADGFSMDVQGADQQFIDTTENMLTAGDLYTAANAGKTNAVGVSGFHSFLTFDFATFPQDPDVLTAWIARAVKHPSYYRYKGLPFVSTYTGGNGGYARVKGLWQTVLANLKAQGISIYFVPGFEPCDAAGNGLASDVPGFTAQASGLLTQIPAQGAWDYGAALGVPLSASRTTLPRLDALSQVTKAFNLSYMATVSPQFEGLDKPGRWYNEYYGGEMLDHLWQSILGYGANPLFQPPSWVQFVSWNDYGEYSRLTNADEGPGSPWPYLAHSSQADYYLSTLGLQTLNLYYLQWYKTGVRPTFSTDNLFAFYRTQPAALDVPGDEGNKIGYVTLEDNEGPGPLLGLDTFFIATGLPSQGTLTVTNGGQTWTRQVPAGLFFSRIGPFVPGPVSMTISRIGGVTATLTGHAIAGSATFYNWSVWSGWAHN